MMQYFLGVDVGGTKTHAVIVDETGRVAGFGEAGPGNHQGVGYDGMLATLRQALTQVLTEAQLGIDQIAGAGFGIAGYDWPSETARMEKTIRALGLEAPFRMVNDAVPGIIAGAQDGWGIGVVSGTGCNCYGLSKDHQRIGRVSGYGIMMGEGAGGTEIVFRAMQMVNYAWIKRVTPTALTQAFINHVGANDELDLIEGYAEQRYDIGAAAAPLIFQVAEAGDEVARDVIRWAGVELGEMVKAVIRQLEFESLTFDVVLAGSMFSGGARLIDPMKAAVHELAPGARFVRPSVPPVAGAVLLGMESGGHQITAQLQEVVNTAIACARPRVNPAFGP
jgi:N-acetylglucosamine kinase-like BadF-type ATPase